jgi:hypothetical protein
MKPFALGGLVVAALAVSGAAMADTITYTGGTPVLNGANWTLNSPLPQWDPALFPGQTLTGVSIRVVGTVTGTARGENEDLVPAVVSLDLSASLTITCPLSLVVTTLPLVNSTFNASAYDGLTDFGGTSGITLPNLSNTDTQSASLTSPPTNLSAYIGNGTILANIASTSTSTGSGPGNATYAFTTRTGAAIEITYTYVPAPGAVALGGMGLLAASRRRRA